MTQNQSGNATGSMPPLQMGLIAAVLILAVASVFLFISLQDANSQLDDAEASATAVANVAATSDANAASAQSAQANAEAGATEAADTAATSDANAAAAAESEAFAVSERETAQAVATESVDAAATAAADAAAAADSEATAVAESTSAAEAEATAIAESTSAAEAAATSDGLRVAAEESATEAAVALEAESTRAAIAEAAATISAEEFNTLMDNRATLAAESTNTAQQLADLESSVAAVPPTPTSPPVAVAPTPTTATGITSGNTGFTGPTTSFSATAFSFQYPSDWAEPFEGSSGSVTLGTFPLGWLFPISSEPIEALTVNQDQIGLSIGVVELENPPLAPAVMLDLLMENLTENNPGSRFTSITTASTGSRNVAYVDFIGEGTRFITFNPGGNYIALVFLYAHPDEVDAAFSTTAPLFESLTVR